MKRDIFKKLISWKNKANRKPLILMGARQVGKTYILKQFAEAEYTSYIYINFDKMRRLKASFENSLDPEDIIRWLNIETQQTITADTLIIFDEIQECPNALNSLKYFNESKRDYHICAAGSLLGVKTKNIQGFPVGQVEQLHLYPLSFFEFLSAIDEVMLRQHLESIQVIKPINESLHLKLLECFKYYCFIGGMPEAVKTYIEEKNLVSVRHTQDNILSNYELDFSKHAPQEHIVRINQVWEHIPSQLAKENKKFIYSVIRKGARASDFELAIQWLNEAGLIQKTYHCNTPQMPLKAYVDFTFFKVYLLDVGLLGAKVELSAKMLLGDNNILSEFKGSLTENVVSQLLVLNTPSTYYWTSSGRAELDFILQENNAIYPLEVKSGLSSKKKSLLVYKEKYAPKHAIRTSPNNLRLDGSLLNCPLYLLERLPQFIAILS